MTRSKILFLAIVAAVGFTIGVFINQVGQTKTTWQTDNIQTEQDWNFKRQAVTPPAWNKN